MYDFIQMCVICIDFCFKVWRRVLHLKWYYQGQHKWILHTIWSWRGNDLESYTRSIFAFKIRLKCIIIHCDTRRIHYDMQISTFISYDFFTNCRLALTHPSKNQTISSFRLLIKCTFQFLLAHLTRRLKWAFLIKICPSSLLPLSLL